MMEYQVPRSNKRICIKVIAWIVLCVFSWNQIAYSADLFSYRPATTAMPGSGPIEPKGKEKEVTNYDLFHYNQKQSGIRKLLPSAKEQEQSGAFSPNYLNKIYLDIYHKSLYSFHE